MTAEVGRGEGRKNGGNSVLVAIHMDGDGRDLLSWTISNAADAGDHIVAVHVYRKSDLHSLSLLSLTKALDNFLSEYESTCNARKVVLVGRLAHGSSIRKTIVKEAEICDATTVVVGVNMNIAFRGPASLSKYCARKLPASVSLLAVHDGKVTYERKATVLPQGRPTKINHGGILHPILTMRSEGAIPFRDKVEKEKGAGRLSSATSSKGSMDEDAAGRTNANMSLRHKGRRSLSLLVEKFPEKPSGWPLQRAASMDLSASRDEAARNMPVVQWVMNLPDRSQQSRQAQEDSHASTDHFVPGNTCVYADLCKELETIFEANSRGYRWFSRTELKESTHDFSSDNLIGNGGCSHVFRGCLSDGLEIAVKKTKLSKEALKDFILEAQIVTSLQHDHIVQLIGVCIDKSEIISVYNFFSRGSLEENLHGKKVKQPLPWRVRYKVALGIAEALNYLHANCPRSIIHRDVKSSNILLSGDFEPQLSDFGLAIWAPNTSTSITYNDVVGTFGYLAPEYFMYGKVSDKVDVYSFGVVLLELLTGRKPICSENSKGQESLIMWVTKMLEQGELMGLLDSSIESDCNRDQIQRMILAATISIRRVARFRPKMSQVLALLKGEEAMEGWIKPCSNRISKEEEDYHDEEAYPPSSVASHLEVAFQDIDDTTSTSSAEQACNHLEDHLYEQWSRSSSFN